jgi:hypothetical protein
MRAKRCRYAVEAVAPVFGRQAGRFAAAIAAVRDILGDHQGSVVAEAWLRAARAALSPARLAAGKLIAAERRERARLRSRWPKVWKRARARNCGVVVKTLTLIRAQGDMAASPAPCPRPAWLRGSTHPAIRQPAL